MSDNKLYTGFQDVRTPLNDTSSDEFMMRQMLARVHTAKLVKVLSVTTTGQVNKPGFVDVVILVDQIDGDGKTTAHGPMHNLPFARVAAGGNAVILDPQPDDIGVAIFADRDISAVKNTADRAPPGSRRRHSASDGIYLFSVVKGAPTQYIRFFSGGISIKSPGTVAIEASAINVTGPMTVNGNVATTGTLKNNGVDVGSTHVHINVEVGGGTSGPPQP